MDMPPGRVGPRNPRQPHDFDEMYATTPPWDIGRPQPAFLALADAGALQGSVLDAGCGTGEHALMAAERGLDVTGIDLARAAIAAAEAKARDRGLAARFLVHDALRLPELGQFDTVLDCGLFHVFDDEDRARFLVSLAGAVKAGGRYFLLCFSDRQPGDWGPRRITEAEIRHAFADGWHIDSLEPSIIEVTLDPPDVQAWLMAMTRT
jgi:cyclopropane fatty-acyl-phospholipid synthase-like methyltransferase